MLHFIRVKKNLKKIKKMFLFINYTRIFESSLTNKITQL